MTGPQPAVAKPDGVDVKMIGLADAANVSAEGKLNVLGVFNIIWAQQVPVTWPQMWFVCQLELSIGLGPLHRFRLRCLDEDMQLIGQWEFNAQMTGPAKVPGVPVGLPLIIGIGNAQFGRHGTYEFQLWREEACVGRTHLHVVQPPSPPPA